MHGAPGRREKEKHKVLLLILAWWEKHVHLITISCSTIIPGYPLVPAFRNAAYLHPKKKKKHPFLIMFYHRKTILSLPLPASTFTPCHSFHVISLVLSTCFIRSSCQTQSCFHSSLDISSWNLPALQSVITPILPLTTLNEQSGENSRFSESWKINQILNWKDAIWI